MAICSTIKLVNSCWRNWPQTRMDAGDEIDIRSIWAGGVMIGTELKGLELKGVV